MSGIAMRAFGATGLDSSILGLGCSHIASLSTRVGAADIARLLDAAWDGGVRFFDTADIYGQGDSERRLARIVARPGAVVCTKAGLALSRSQAAVRLVKPMLRPVLTRLKGARAKAAGMRAAAEVSDLDIGGLERRLEGSLRRLRRDHVDIFLLHSPPRAALEDGALFDLLDRIKHSGKARVTGVSVRTLEDADWVLAQNRVEALQIPLPPGASADGTLARAQAAGVGIVAREVLGGLPPAQVLPGLLADPRISVTLTGTTQRAHLAENLRLAQEV